jgi:O-antigen ligase
MAAHNAFFQLWIYWGLPALIAFLFLMKLYSKAMDRNIEGNRRKACLYIFVMMIPLIFIFYHSFYHKTFSIGIGMLLSTRFWNIFDEQTDIA